MADQAPFCTRPDIGTFGARADAIDRADVDVIDATISARTAWICSFLGQRVGLPIIAWGADVTQACAIAVAWDLTSAPIGRNPEVSVQDDPLYLRFRGIERWLEQIAKGGPMPAVPGTIAAVPAAPPGAARVVSNTSRGWQDFGDHGGAFSGGRGGR